MSFLPRFEARSYLARSLDKASKQRKTTKHAPLDEHRREIRLVTILPGKFNDRIYCRLDTASLDDPNLSYEALSYVWGSLRRVSPIEVNGVSHAITSNLDLALRYLRRPDRLRVMWIDQLCINQRDLQELGLQVKLMGQIYKQADAVIAWLGEEDKQYLLAIDFMELTNGQDENSHFDGAVPPQLGDVSMNVCLEAVADFCTVPWWTRVWTVQEGVLCPKVYLQCGQRQILLDDTTKIYKRMLHHKECSSCSHLFTQFLFLADFVLFKGVNNVIMLDRLRHQLSSRSRIDLVSVLTNFSLRQCSDPRDKVYGFLGLADFGRVGTFTPHHTSTVAEVYTDFASLIVQEESNLDIISTRLATRPGDLHHLPGLPGWVPNWTIDDSGRAKTISDRVARLHEYSASGSSQHQGKIVSNGTLHVRGHIIAKLAMRSTATSSYREHIHALMDFQPGSKEANAGTSDAAARRRRARILCANFSDSNWSAGRRHSGDGPSLMTCFETWWIWYSILRANHDRLDDADPEVTRAEIIGMHARIKSITSERVLFVSDDEKFEGLAPSDAKVGDHVVLLAGGKIPYILRPRTNKHTTTGETVQEYDFVGDGYIPGMMDGELWSDDGLSELILH